MEPFNWPEQHQYSGGYYLRCWAFPQTTEQKPVHQVSLRVYGLRGACTFPVSVDCVLVKVEDPIKTHPCLALVKVSLWWEDKDTPEDQHWVRVPSICGELKVLVDTEEIRDRNGDPHHDFRPMKWVPGVGMVPSPP